MKSRYLVCLLAIAFLGLPRLSASEDIDLFVQQNTAGSRPNVLLVIDTAANFSATSQGGTCAISGVTNSLSGTVGGIEQCALYAVISGLEPDTVNLGVMLYNGINIARSDGSHCPTTNAYLGGCLAFPMLDMSTTNKAALLAWIASWTTSSGFQPGQVKSNNEATGAAMQEAWAFFNGHTGISGYKYPALPASGCNPSNYVIFIGNSYNKSGSPGDQSDANGGGPHAPLVGTAATADMNANPAATFREQSPITSTITTSCGAFTFPSGTIQHNNGGYYADEWALYMHDHGITTYSIGVLQLPGSSNNSNYCQANYAALLTSMGDVNVGGGKYFPTYDMAGLELAFRAALSEIKAKNSVFASVSLPVAVNTEGTYLNQVYIGMFRPDAQLKPRWYGNLKQYRLALYQGNLRLFDSKPVTDSTSLAISSSSTGFISVCAVSYWTPTADDTYWNTYPYNSTDPSVAPPTCDPHPAISNTPDGEAVEKGAQGYVLRTLQSPANNRNMLTCDAMSCWNGTGYSLDVFKSTNSSITAAMLGNASLTNQQRSDLMNWALGLNNNGDETFVAATATRPSVDGDVLHSRPFAVNYGTSTAPEVVVFYGANDGALRAINGNRTSNMTVANASGGSLVTSPSTVTVGAGAEIWSFMPPEFLPDISRLRQNSPNVKYSFLNSDPTSPSYDPNAQEKPYGMDGPIAGYQDSGKTWIFAGMRRGGRALYAFDVSAVGTNGYAPLKPTLLWKVGCPDLTDDTGCTSGFSGIGQTWSAAKILKAGGYPTTLDALNNPIPAPVPSPMLIMGGGYDACEDADPNGCTATKGNVVYVLDAATGTILKALTTDRAVVGDVLVVPNDTTGLAEYAYAADTGGNIYRIAGSDGHSPFGTDAPSTWTITKIAALGCASSSCQSGEKVRKFLFGPDVVRNGNQFAIMIGSGDREKPLYNWSSAYNATNYFFMVEDTPSDTNWLSGGPITLASLYEVQLNATSPNALASNYKGWYMDLHAHEQVVTSAITVYGITTFSTQIPAPPVDPTETSCSIDSTAYVYNVNFATAAPPAGTNNRDALVQGGGLPPSPVAGQVRLDDGTLVPFVIGANPTSPLEAELPVGAKAGSQPKGFTYWYIQK